MEIHQAVAPRGCITVFTGPCSEVEVADLIWKIIKWIDVVHIKRPGLVLCEINRGFLQVEGATIGLVQIVAPEDSLDVPEGCLADLEWEGLTERRRPGNCRELPRFCETGDGPMGMDFANRAINAAQYQRNQCLYGLIRQFARRDGIELPDAELHPVLGTA